MMQDAVAEIFLWLLGLCVGSFLNVVVYRLPLGMSIAEPRRSFCPRCRAGIGWHDNLPLLSWLLLRGRCRHCAAPISIRYPLVEALTGLVFVLVYHILFVAQAREGLVAAEVPRDGALLVVWLVLAAGLLACAAMDIVSYTVDVRVTLVVLAASIVLHALWPRGEFLTPTAATAGAAAATAVFVASAVLLWVSMRGAEAEEDDRPPPADEPEEEAGANRLAGVFGALTFVVLGAVVVTSGLVTGPDRGFLVNLAAGLSLLAMFLTIVLAGGQQRRADEEIRQAIEDEQPLARGTALRELVWLTPAIAAGLLACIAVSAQPAVREFWRAVVVWSPGAGFTPVGGAVFAIHGAMVGAAAGWTLRILFTLVFGREAFGTGDIYILAAAGAAAGWDIALLGLLLAVGVALLGWMIGLALKATVMIPFGPWLALGFLLALLWNQAALDIARDHGDNLSLAWRQRPDLVMTGVGLMLVATAAAISLARLVRRWVDPAS